VGTVHDTVAQALRQHAPKFLQQLTKANRGVAIRKAFAAIMRCRTGELGGVHWSCTRCERSHWVGRSCGNRHCPTCGHDKTQQWLERQSQKLLAGVPHFLVTFTVPRELREVLRTYQRAGYEALFQASSQALTAVASKTKSLQGAQLGFFGVLHTWGRDPEVYHPHVHYVVPGGGAELDSGGKVIAWKSTSINFLVNHQTLIRVYKAKLADALRAANLYQKVSPNAWTKKFVVDIQPVDNGKSAVAYLGSVRASSGSERSSDQGRGRDFGDVSIQAEEIATSLEPHGVGRGVRQELCPAHSTDGLSEGAVLWLDGQ
jgi:hypothetical protein